MPASGPMWGRGEGESALTLSSGTGKYKPTIQVDPIPHTAGSHGAAVGQPLLRAGDQDLGETVGLLVGDQGTFAVGSEDIYRLPLALPDERGSGSDGGVEDLDLGGGEGVVVDGGEGGDGIGTGGLFGFAVGGQWGVGSKWRRGGGATNYDGVGGS